jgi:hypothetical protein
MKNILKKLSEARKQISETKLKKEGKNSFSNYQYFTPEQIFSLTSEAEQKTGLISKFDLVSENENISGKLTIFDVESGENIEFKMMTAIPEIKATNVAQQLGGAVTYTHRYLLTTAYKIAENHLDFDSDTNTPANPQKQVSTTQKSEQEVKTWLTKEQFDIALKADIKGISAVLKKFSENGNAMKKEYREELKKQLAWLETQNEQKF